MKTPLNSNQTVITLIDIEEVFIKCNKKLYQFIKKRVNNHDDVMDILQTTYLEAIRNQQQFQGASQPETWIFGIAMNLVRTHYKQKKRYYLHDDIENPQLNLISTQGDPREITENQQLLELALNYIDKLPADIQSMLVTLVIHHGNYQDVADSLAIPIGTVRSRLFRLRAALQQLINR